VPQVNLAHHRRRDERGAVLLQAPDDFAHFGNERIDSRPSQQLKEILEAQPGLPDDSPQGAPIQLVVVWNHHLGEWLIPSHHDVASRLPLRVEARTLQRPDTVPAGDARQLGHTATTIVSKRSGGTGR
jgi:hypothetical protein